MLVRASFISIFTSWLVKDFLIFNEKEKNVNQETDVFYNILY